MGTTNFPHGISSFGVPVFGGIYVPPIIGTYYHVCPGTNTIVNAQGKQVVGSAGNDGLTPETPLASIETAYDKCVSGAGDGIIVWGYGTATAHNTSYLTSTLTWDKSGITVVGVTGPTATSQRARIANASASTGVSPLIDVTGNDNRFINLQIGNWGSGAGALGVVDISGGRNYFENVHFAGPGNATPAQTTGSYAVHIDGGDENRFVHCVFGIDTVDQDGSQAATGTLKFSVGCQTNVFEDCTFLAYWSYASAICGAIHHVGSGDSITRTQQFIRCRFINFKTGLPTTTPPLSLVVGTAPNNGVILLDGCTMLGYAAYDGTGTNDRVYVTTPATNATGGLAVVTA